MKKILIYTFVFLSFIVPFSCDEKEDILTENAMEGGLINPSTTSVNYVVGDAAAYSFDLNLVQGKTSKQEMKEVRIYKSVFRGAVAFSNPETEGDSIPARWSNEVLEETIAISNSKSHSVSATPLNFASLRDALIIDDEELPLADSDMNIGDYFNFRIETTLSTGRVIEQAYNVKMAVSTRFAGKYRLVSGVYFRIVTPAANTGSYWPAEILIESIDAKTYRMVGVSAWDDQQLFFQIEDDGSITYPAEWKGVAQTINGSPLITCSSDPANMLFVPCDVANLIDKDDVDGKDRLNMAYGYLTSGSADPVNDGPRQFHQILEKIVE